MIRFACLRAYFRLGFAVCDTRFAEMFFYTLWQQVNRNYKRVIVPDILLQNILQRMLRGSVIKESYVHSKPAI